MRHLADHVVLFYEGELGQLCLAPGWSIIELLDTQREKKIKQLRYYRQCCGSKYIESGSRPKILTKFDYGSMVRIQIYLKEIF